MKDIHHKAAYVFAVLLPFAETVRRGSEIGYWPNYADDYFIGIILFLAARAVSKQKPYGQAFLVAAWALLCGGFYYSFTGQFQLEQDVSGVANNIVILIKAVLYSCSILFLVMSVRAMSYGRGNIR